MGNLSFSSPETPGMCYSEYPDLFNWLLQLLAVGDFFA